MTRILLSTWKQFTFEKDSNFKNSTFRHQSSYSCTFMTLLDVSYISGNAVFKLASGPLVNSRSVTSRDLEANRHSQHHEQQKTEATGEVYLEWFLHNGFFLPVVVWVISIHVLWKRYMKANILQINPIWTNWSFYIPYSGENINIIRIVLSDSPCILYFLFNLSTFTLRDI